MLFNPRATLLKSGQIKAEAVTARLQIVKGDECSCTHSAAPVWLMPSTPEGKQNRCLSKTVSSTAHSALHWHIQWRTSARLAVPWFTPEKAAFAVPADAPLQAVPAAAGLGHAW